MAEGYVWVIYSEESKTLMPDRGVFDTKGACQRAIDNQLKSFAVDIRKNFTPKKLALADLLSSPQNH